MTKFYTYKRDVPLRAGETLGYVRGRGYYARRSAVPPARPPFFGGVGLFTAWDPRAALRAKGTAVRWVAVTTDRGAQGEAWGTRAHAGELRAAGLRVFAWEALARLGQRAVDELGAEGYIVQAENAAEGKLALALGPLTVPKAIVGTPLAFATWPSGWELVLEDYWNVQPWLAPSKISSEGVRVSSLLYGLYDASVEAPGVGRRVPLAAYLRDTPPGLVANWSGYLAEEMSEDDWATLATLPH